MARMSLYERRLRQELISLVKEPPAGVTVQIEAVEKNLLQWLVNVEGASDTLYEGERFQLQFRFTKNYPYESPAVMFVGTNIPIHPYVYSNGHMCISILSDEWSPALSVKTVCLSILSMLSSCTEKIPAPDDSHYIRTCNENPKKRGVDDLLS